MKRAVWLGAGLLVAGCNALLDIDHIQFGDSTSAGGATASGAGAQAGGPSASSVGETSGGGFPPAAENCANDVDDNDDNLIDCADPLCACAPEAPPSWSGPVVLYTGSGQVSCPADWPAALYTGFVDVTADPVTCDACTCGAASVSCSASISFWSVTQCQGSAVRTAQETSQTCVNITNGQHLSARGTVPTASGSCPSMGGAITNMPAPVFTADAVLCAGAATGASCTPPASCVPLPPAPFMGQICIYKTSGGSCSNGEYTEEHHFYRDLVDTRGCSSCDCALNASCTATTNVYPQAGCSGTPLAVPHTNNCVNVPAPASRMFIPSPNGSCSPIGGDPGGDVSGDNPVTVCCLP